MEKQESKEGYRIININSTPQNFNQIKDSWNKYNIKGLSINMRNYNKNIDKLNILLNNLDNNFDFLALSETWLDEEQAKATGAYLKGYKIEWTKRKYNKNGGVAIGIKENKRYRTIDHSNQELEADYIIVEILEDDPKDNYTIIAIYRNHGRKGKTFIEGLRDLLENKKHINKRHIIIGDWNINLDNESELTRKLEENMAIHI